MLSGAAYHVESSKDGQTSHDPTPFALCFQICIQAKHVHRREQAQILRARGWVNFWKVSTLVEVASLSRKAAFTSTSCPPGHSWAPSHLPPPQRSPRLPTPWAGFGSLDLVRWPPAEAEGMLYLPSPCCVWRVHVCCVLGSWTLLCRKIW